MPISAARGLVVETHWELEPDSDLDDLVTLLVDLPETTLVCTHREVFEKLLGWDAPCEKGALWVLERNGRELVPDALPRAAGGRAVQGSGRQSEPRLDSVSRRTPHRHAARSYRSS